MFGQETLFVCFGIVSINRQPSDSRNGTGFPTLVDGSLDRDAYEKAVEEATRAAMPYIEHLRVVRRDADGLAILQGHIHREGLDAMREIAMCLKINVALHHGEAGPVEIIDSVAPEIDTVHLLQSMQSDGSGEAKEHYDFLECWPRAQEAWHV